VLADGRVTDDAFPFTDTDSASRFRMKSLARCTRILAVTTVRPKASATSALEQPSTSRRLRAAQ